MGGYKKKSSFSSVISSIFSSCSGGGREYDDLSDDSIYTQRVCPSDEDRGHWIAEPGIDRKASDFIARFYASRMADPDRQAMNGV